MTKVMFCNKLIRMNTIRTFSTFTKSLLIYNLVVILLFSALFFDIWGKVYPPYLDTFFFLEIFVIFSTVALYFYWLYQLSTNKIDFKFFIPTLSLITVLLFAVGQHSSANQIHIFVEHPSIMLFDEYVSHWTLVFALALIGGSFSWLQLLVKEAGKPLSLQERGLLSVSGVIQGSIIGIYAVEGRSGWLAGILSVATLIFIGKWLKGRKLTSFALPLYYAVAYISVIFILIVWYFQYGGFFEPSAIGFGRF
jgi:hypothetical protein